MLNNNPNIALFLKYSLLVFVLLISHYATILANDIDDQNSSGEVQGAPENKPNPKEKNNPDDKSNPEVKPEYNFIIDSDEPEQIFVNITYSRLFNNTIISYFYKDEIFYPVSEILDALKINYELSNDGKLFQGNFITNDKNYSLDFSKLSGKMGEMNISFSKNDVLQMEGKFYVLPGIIESLFGIKMKLDYGSLTLTITSKEKLPVLIFNDMASGRNKLAKDFKEVTAPLLYERDRSLFNFGFIDYSVSGNYSRKTDPVYNYDFMIGTEVLGGNLNTTLKGAVGNNNDKSFFENMNKSVKWEYVLSKNSFLNKVNVGEISRSGFNQGFINGISITNTPVESRTNFDMFTITERTVPNSEVELYLNNRLYDFKTADALGNVFFEVPVTFGSNDIYLKIFSPTGEIITSEKRVIVPSGFLPAGSVDYNASFGFTKEIGQKFYSADVSVGITSWLTNKSGFEKVENDIFNKPVWFNSLSARILSQYYLNVTTAPDVYHRATLNASTKSRASFEVSYTKFQKNPLYNKTNQSDETYFRGLIPYEIAGKQFVSQGYFRSVRYVNNQSITRFDIEQSVNLSGFNASINFHHTKNRFASNSESLNRASLGTHIYVTNIPMLDFLKNNVINTKIDYNFTKKTFEGLQTTLTSNISRTIRLQLGYRTGFTKGSSSVTAQFAFDMPFSRNYVSMSNNSVSTTVQGSVGFDMNDTKLNYSLYNRPKVGSGAAIFRMFHDENNNGIYDEGEELIEDLPLNILKVGSIKSNDANVLISTELIPNLEYIVEINDISPKNPTLFPKFKRFSFETSANVYKKIDIPFYRTQEVFGSVIVKKGNNEMKIGGIKVTLINDDTNEEITLTTYSDGGLYHIGIMPGTYTAYVNPSHLENLKGVSTPDILKLSINGSNTDNELNFVINLD